MTEGSPRDACRDASRPVACSVVIPVYNSAAILPETVARLRRFFAERALDYEIVLVNDGSRDRSWQVIEALAEADPHLRALDLVRNMGQHVALLCGIGEARGEYVVTMDDDLQNEPDQIAHLIARAAEGCDLVFGRYRAKQHDAWRRLGSTAMRMLIRRICAAPPDLYVSNFRLLRREVVERMLAMATTRPNVSCLALLCARRPGDAEVDHRPRREGRSGYTLRRLAALMLNTLFEYSVLPLWAAAGSGAAIVCAFYALALLPSLIQPSDARLEVAARLAAEGAAALALLGVLSVIGIYVARGARHRHFDRVRLIAERLGGR
jgi:hypothetical protein